MSYPRTYYAVSFSRQPLHTTKSSCFTDFSPALAFTYRQIGELRSARSNEISFFFLIINSRIGATSTPAQNISSFFA
jgi:hypothetical protein